MSLIHLSSTFLLVFSRSFPFPCLTLCSSLNGAIPLLAFTKTITASKAHGNLYRDPLQRIAARSTAQHVSKYSATPPEK